MLEDENNELIERAMIAWILANIVYKDKKNIEKEISLIEKVLDVTEEDKRNRNEKVWFALALLKIDISKGNKIWEKMRAIDACSITQKNEYNNIKNNNDQEKNEIIKEIKVLLKNQKEKSYFDMKKELKIVNVINKAELIKDIITLVNSAFQNNNVAYMKIEKRQKIIFCNISLQLLLFQV